MQEIIKAIKELLRLATARDWLEMIPPVSRLIIGSITGGRGCSEAMYIQAPGAPDRVLVGRQKLPSGSRVACHVLHHAACGFPHPLQVLAYAPPC